MLSFGLKAVLGSYSGQTSEKRGYFIILSDIGAIYRIDYYIYSFEYKSETLVKVAKNVNSEYNIFFCITPKIIITIIHHKYQNTCSNF